jgi:hypothetical protein
MIAGCTCAVFALALALGCAPKRSGENATNPPSSPSPEKEALPEPETPAVDQTCQVVHMETCKDELEAVARCFYDSVTEAQKEPGEMPLARFLAENASSVDSCSAIGIDESCETLRLSGGDAVKHAHEMAAHDNYEDHDVMHIVYTFSAESCPAKAEAKIELHI